MQWHCRLGYEKGGGSNDGNLMKQEDPHAVSNVGVII